MIEALIEIRDHVQWMREESETDLRGLLHLLNTLIKEHGDVR